MTIYSVSDVHIKYFEEADDVARREIFLKFLESIKSDADILILNGDIFDLWIEWKDKCIPEYMPIIEKLKEFSDNGCRLIFLYGNHDFWLGDFLRNELNAEIYPDQFVETIDEKRLFVTHGDMLTVNDARYHFFRTIIRLPFVRSFVQILPMEFVLKLGAGMSRTSRKRTKPRRLSDNQGIGLLDFAREHSFKHDLFLMGHVHSPQIQNVGKAIFINSGDWITHRTYVKIVDGRPQLIDFETNEIYPIKEKK